MKKYLRRLVYRTDNQKHNFLMHPFLLMTASYGIALTFFQDTRPVQQSILYSLTATSDLLPNETLSIWGVIAMIVTVVNFIGIIVRNRRLGTSVSMVGFMLWFYSFWVYALYNYWLQVFFVSVPNMLFWGWYYVTIHKYHDSEEDLLH